MTKDKCCMCLEVREGHWALLFGPPMYNYQTNLDTTHKQHICPDCYIKILNLRPKNK